jgi:hypothetical protein
MGEIMTRLQAYSLLAILELFGILVLTIAKILPIAMCLILLLLLIIPMLELARAMRFRDSIER